MFWFQQLSRIATQLSRNCVTDQSLQRAPKVVLVSSAVSNCLALQPSFLVIVTKHYNSVHGCVGFSNELSRTATQLSCNLTKQSLLARMTKIVLVYCLALQPNIHLAQMHFLVLVLVSLSISMSLRKLLAFGAVKNAARDELLFWIEKMGVSCRITFHCVGFTNLFSRCDQTVCLRRMAVDQTRQPVSRENGSFSGRITFHLRRGPKQMRLRPHCGFTLIIPRLPLRMHTL